MKVRALKDDNDWSFGRGRNDYVSDRKAVAQMVKTRLKSFLGDCFFDLGAGIDWFNLLGSKQEIELRLAISSTLLNTQGVLSIREISFTLGRQSRIFLVQYDLDTIYGNVIGEVENA